MPRYGNDFGRWEASGGYGRDYGYGDRGGYGSGGGAWEGWMGDRGGFAGGWRGQGQGGYSGGYDAGHGGAYGYDPGMGGGYGGRSEMGYGDRGGYDMGRGMRTGESLIGERGGRQGGGRMRAADIMTEDPATVTPDATLADVAMKMRDLDVGIIPVVEDAGSRRLRGVITDRDIAVRAVAEGKDGSTTVRECMTERVETVNKNDSVDRVMDLMQREQVRRVPVTDREGRLVGIIAQADLALEFTDDQPQRERMVEDTIERISEPGRTHRAGGRSRGRSSGMDG